MKKSLQKIIAVILAAGVVCGSAANVSAETGSITITGNFTERFALDYDNTNFLQAEYITPGNVYLSHMYLKNMSDREMSVKVSDIAVHSKTVGGNGEALSDELYLWIYRGDGEEISDYKELLYSGKYSSGKTEYITVQPYKTETLSVIVALSPDAGNDYQGLEMESKWNISAVLSDSIADLPTDPPAVSDNPSATNPPSNPSGTNSPVKPSWTNPPENPQGTNSPSSPSWTNPPGNPQETNIPSKPSRTNPPGNPQGTNSPSNPSETNFPSNPSWTNPPGNPSETNSPDNPSETNPPGKPDSTRRPSPDGSGSGSAPNTLIYNYIINYIDEDGNELAPSSEGKGLIGRKIYAYAVKIPGYKPDMPEKMFWIKATKTVINFIYTKADSEPPAESIRPSNTSAPGNGNDDSNGDNNGGNNSGGNDNGNNSGGKDPDGNGSGGDGSDGNGFGDNGNDLGGNGSGVNDGGDSGNDGSDENGSGGDGSDGNGSGDNGSGDSGNDDSDGSGSNNPDDEKSGGGLITKIFRRGNDGGDGGNGNGGGDGGNGNGGGDSSGSENGGGDGNGSGAGTHNKPVKTGANIFENSSKPLTFTILAALTAAFGIPLAVIRRKKKKSEDGKGGETV